jgi:hypothetical protein
LEWSFAFGLGLNLARRLGFELGVLREAEFSELLGSKLGKLLGMN